MLQYRELQNGYTVLPAVLDAGLRCKRDVHGVTHTFPGVGTSTPSVTASAGQSSSRNTQDTFDYGPQEIGMSQLQDAPSTQQTQPRAQRQRRPKKRYTPGTDGLGKGKTRSSKQ